MRPDVARFEGGSVHFVDGAATEVDLVVFATGLGRRIRNADESEGQAGGLVAGFGLLSAGLLAAGGIAVNTGPIQYLFDDLPDPTASRSSPLPPAARTSRQRERWLSACGHYRRWLLCSPRAISCPSSAAR